MNKTTSNPYAQQVLAQGRDLSNAPAPKREFPCTIGARTFETEAEYQEALAEFLNGYWDQLERWHTLPPIPPADALPLPYEQKRNV